MSKLNNAHCDLRRRVAKQSCVALALLFVTRSASMGQSQAAPPLTVADLGGVPISVAVPATLTALNDEQRAQLEGKLLELVTAAGLSGVGPNAGFVLVPSVSIGRQVTAGSLRAMQVVQLGVTLVIRQTSQNIAYATTSTTLSGSGDTAPAAITNAIGNVSPTDERLLQFIDTGKRRVVQYYETNCEAVRADARTKAGTGSPNAALALLLSVPREASACQSKASDDALRLFTAYQEHECKGLVGEARGSIAGHNFSAAISLLARVDPSSRCAKSADSLVGTIDRQISKAADDSLKRQLETIHATRDPITRSLDSPAKVVERQQQLTKKIAVDEMNQSLSIRVHRPS